MDNYIALILLVVPGFISRKIYGKLSDQRSVINSFEETIYSLIFSVFNLLALYALTVICFWVTGQLQLLNKESILELFNNSHLIALYVILNLLSSFLTAVIWKLVQPSYIMVMSRFKNGKNGNEIIPSDSIFYDVFNDGDAHLVEIYKEDRLIARGILAKTHHEQGDYYLEDAEEEFKMLLKRNLKLEYKGYCFSIKSGLLIKEVKI